MAKRVSGDGVLAAIIFGVFLQELGSYTLGEIRFTPFRAVSCPAETKDLACEETSPVKFFDDEEEAKTEAAKLKAKFDLKRNPQPKQD